MALDPLSLTDMRAAALKAVLVLYDEHRCAVLSRHIDGIIDLNIFAEKQCVFPFKPCQALQDVSTISDPYVALAGARLTRSTASFKFIKNGDRHGKCTSHRHQQPKKKQKAKNSQAFMK